MMKRYERRGINFPFKANVVCLFNEWSNYCTLFWVLPSIASRKYTTAAALKSVAVAIFLLLALAATVVVPVPLQQFPFPPFSLSTSANGMAQVWLKILNLNVCLIAQQLYAWLFGKIIYVLLVHNQANLCSCRIGAPPYSLSLLLHLFVQLLLLLLVLLLLLLVLMLLLPLLWVLLHFYKWDTTYLGPSRKWWRQGRRCARYTRTKISI